jgi:D-alanyl-D-alanine carboxypeptidase
MVVKRWIAPMVVLIAVAIGACSGAGASGEESTVPPSTELLTDASTSATTTTTLAPPPTSTSVAAPTIDDEFLAEQVAKSWDPNRPGAVMVSVYGPDGGVAHASVGTDPSGAAPTPDDLFRIGSISKLFASLTVLSLVDDGLVDLDAPLSQYIDRADIDAAVTVRDALQHTSGIPDYTESPDFLDVLLADTGREWTPEESIGLGYSGALDFEPGSTFVYSNTNYIMLGLLVEEVTGLPYHEAVRDRVTGPLGLTSTYLAGFEDGPAVFGGYYEFLGSVEPLTFNYTSIATSAWSAGAIVSNGYDLHTLLTALFAGEIVSPALVKEMTANPEYGFAIYVPGFTSETPLFGHDGRIPGSGTFLVHAPETGMTVFTVSNADHLKVTPATSGVAEVIGVRGVQLVSTD